jgi:hypothetical protein
MKNEYNLSLVMVNTFENDDTFKLWPLRVYHETCICGDILELTKKHFNSTQKNSNFRIKS